MDENDILTAHHLAHAWGVERHVAQRRAARWAQRLGIKRVKARSPSGQVISAYSRGDGERIIEAQREREAGRESNTARKNKKAKEIEFQIGTSNRRDVMTVHELAKILSVSRSHASQIARRLGGKLGIKRVEARAASTHQKIVAYLRSDGERLIKLFKDKRAARSTRREAKEKRNRERERIPQPAAPSSQNELFYLIELSPADTDQYKLGWTSDINERLRGYRTISPNLRLVKSWPCERKRDREAMAYAFLFPGLRRIKSETFRTQDIQALVKYLDQFFETATDKCS